VAEGGDWFVNWADFPVVMALEDGTLFAHFLAKSGPDTYAYGINVVISRDGGETWSDPVIPHDDSDTEHGFVSMIPLDADRMGMVWLDGRETAGHGHEGGGAMTLRYAALDRDGLVQDETLLDSRICDCCSTDALMNPDGSLVVVYRDRSEEEIRDISIVRRTGTSWSEPSSVHEDGWKIAGCPVNGPEIDFRGDQGAAIWFTSTGEDQWHVRVAFSTDGGRTFGSPIKVDTGNPLGRVDLVLLDDGSVLASWLENGEEGAAAILLRRVEANGSLGEVTVVAPTQSARGSGFPRMVKAGDDVFLVWTEMSEPSQVQTALYR
jgi:hypothetical protein